ncbi:MAG: hypothetical protein DMG06_07015 [Acidobacteria bacterium]|nr:MAG: hypothetical protein DMG06_07015 [Acidobacteriota bacterium]
MRTAGMLLALVMALAIGYFVYKAQLTGTAVNTTPRQQIDVVGVKNDLISIAQSERLYLAANGSYATLDQLQQDGSLSFPGTKRRGYNFVAEVQDAEHFKITATPVDPSKPGWPKLSIDETMQITQW